MTPRYLSFFCALLLLSFGASAQQTNVLRGTVLDPNSLPVSGATIEFHSPSGTRTTLSDDHGAFTITDISTPGTLTIHHSGFATVSQIISAAALANAIAIRMSPAPIVQRIEVSAPADETIPATPCKSVRNFAANNK